MTGKLSRTCQKCEKTDVTEFSTCRYCKTRYTDKGKQVAAPPDPRRNMGTTPGWMGLGLVVIILLCAFIVYYFVMHGSIKPFQSSQPSQPHRTFSSRHR